jgi:hypothetical protein
MNASFSRTVVVIVALAGALLSVPIGYAAAPGVKEVGETLDTLHAAAAKADGATYFALFAPEAVCLGTDVTERWTVAEFKRYAAWDTTGKGRGWTYVVKTRHVDVMPSGDVAWFDEVLTNEWYGVCRGTGVLRKIGGAWRICQYHLTIPVPNELATDVVKLIRGQTQAPATAKP